MVRTRTPSRRQLLVSVALAATAGCVGRDTDGDPGDSEGDANDSGGDPDDGASESASQDEDMDLREANVVDVAFAATDDGYAFDVTLHHDDEGESGYANWWQVERLDGTRLGRRELLHAHSEQPFTRSETITVPDDVTCVIVRGHDQTHGYGGVAAVVDLDIESVRFVDQGPDARSFDATDCP